jgi:hypothetical protein
MAIWAFLDTVARARSRLYPINKESVVHAMLDAESGETQQIVGAVA